MYDDFKIGEIMEEGLLRYDKTTSPAYLLRAHLEKITRFVS